MFTTSLFAAPKKYNVDTKKSTITWYGQKVVGKKHTGTLEIKSGTINVDGTTPISGEFLIDMTTLKNSDLKKKKWKLKLETHLKSPDFFDIVKYKTAKFSFKSVKPEKKGGHILYGDLTIKDKTQPAMIKISADIAAAAIKAKGSLEFDRSKFDVRYGSDQFFDNLGDKLISNIIKLDIVLIAAR